MSEFDAELKRIGDNYIKHLPTVITQIESVWRALRKNSSDKNSYDDLFHLIHNLSGSAGIFGCPEIGDIARKMQELLSSNTIHDVGLEIEAQTRLLKKKVQDLQNPS